MRRETVQSRLYMLAVLLSLRRSDVGSQKIAYTPSCGAGTEKLAKESAAKARSGVLGGNNQAEQGCDASSGSNSGPHNSADRIGPACARGNLGQRGSVH